MYNNLEQYVVKVPENLSLSYSNFKAFRLEVRCKSCSAISIIHHPDDFDDIAVFRCIMCGKEKWIPIYGDTYGLTDFSIFFAKKFKLDPDLMKKIELAALYDASFEAYCESCDCGGRFRRSALLCYRCGEKEGEVINSEIYWRDNLSLISPVKIEWLRYYKHPF